MILLIIDYVPPSTHTTHLYIEPRDGVVDPFVTFFGMGGSRGHGRLRPPTPRAPSSFPLPSVPIITPTHHFFLAIMRCMIDALLPSITELLLVINVPLLSFRQ